LTPFDADPYTGLPLSQRTPIPSPDLEDPMLRVPSVVRILTAGSRRAGGALVVVLLASAARAADPGETGLAFLKIGVGARAAAMGEAYAAVAQDASATYWNPAGIANAPRTEVHASHHEWISDVRYEYLAAVRGLKGHAVGAHAALLHMGKLEGRDDAGNFTESFHAYDLSTGVTYARRIAQPLEVGATAKLLYAKIEDYSATGFAADVGMRYRTPVRGLTAALTFSNVGPEMSFVEDKFTLPFNSRVGLAYRTRGLLDGLVLAADVRVPNDSDPKGHVGVELWPHEMIALRGGAKLGYDEEAGTVGCGIAYASYVFDYAFVPFSDESVLGDTHRLSVTWQRAQ
jgi:hypothetical protein